MTLNEMRKGYEGEVAYQNICSKISVTGFNFAAS